MSAVIDSLPVWNMHATASVVGHVDTQPDTDGARAHAFRRWVQPELELLYAMAMRLTRDPHDAEDLVQDTLVRAYGALDRFDGRYPRAWLLTILRNTNLNRVRKKRPVLLFDPDRTLGQLPTSDIDDHDETAEAALGAIADPELLAALRDLSEDHQAVVALVDVDGLSYREAAELLEIPIGTVMSRLHRARRRLRARLERAGKLERKQR